MSSTTLLVDRYLRRSEAAELWIDQYQADAGAAATSGERIAVYRIALQSLAEECVQLSDIYRRAVAVLVDVAFDEDRVGVTYEPADILQARTPRTLHLFSFVQRVLEHAREHDLVDPALIADFNSAHERIKASASEFAEVFASFDPEQIAQATAAAGRGEGEFAEEVLARLKSQN